MSKLLIVEQEGRREAALADRPPVQQWNPTIA